MNIQSTKPQAFAPASRLSNQDNFTFSENKGNAITEFIKDNPYRTLADVFDVGIGVPAALGASLGAGDAVPVLAVGGALIHGFSAFGHLAVASENSSWGREALAKSQSVTAAGDALSALGLGLAAAGVGPLSLGFIAAGVVTSTLASQ